MEALTNGAILAKEGPSSTTILRRSAGRPQQETDSSNSAVQASKVHWDWKLKEVEPVRKQASERQILTAQPVPACVHSFVKAVAQVPAVKCVVIEDADSDSIHITTFVENITDAVRNQIYSVEAETIHANPNAVFDFHVRRAEEVLGSPASIAGKHYYAIWGELDAERR
jgi:hypothetical protein